MYLADFKAGKEYAPLKGCSAYSCADSAVSMIYNYYELYSEIRHHQNPEIGHVTLVIEEWFGFLCFMESIDKKQKNDLMAKVGEILALGRGIGNGIGIFLLVQRADSSNFSAGSREQFQNLLCFGRLSREQRLMLFAGEDGVKKVRILSGGEKVRCLLSKMMISGANVLLLDEPTNHLDMESITALNNGMIKFPGVLLFTSRDHQIVQTTANRIMEIVPGGKLIDKITTYDEYLESDEMARKRQTYTVETEEED